MTCATVIRPYQQAAVHALFTGEAKYLAAEQGLGKTLMAIEFARQINAKKILVLCDATGKLVWVSEVHKWAPGAKTFMPRAAGHVGLLKSRTSPLWNIVNYDKISRGQDYVDALIEDGPYDLLVLDEAHRLKSTSSKRTLAVFNPRNRCLSNVSRRVLPMSGTPAPNHAGELYVPLRSLAPEIVTKPGGGVMSLMEFEDRYCHVDMRHIGNGRPVRVIKGSRNIQDLRARMGSFMLRLTKKDCLKDLPPLQFVTTPISIGKEAADTLKGFSGVDLSAATDEDILRVVQAGGDHIARDLQLLGLAKAAAAGAFLRDFLDENQRKIVVWANHHTVIDEMMKQLQSFRPVKIDGRDAQTVRAASIDTFLKDPACRVFIGNIQAAGTSITLLDENTKPTDEFFVESRTVPGDNLQAASRIHRVGQNSGVLARVFVANDVPLDVRVQEIITRKTNDLTELFA